jgi:N-ethylmaleimide reductase
MIISEATHVALEGVGCPGTPGIHTQEQVAAWQEVTRAVHGEGGRIFLQLWHVGRVSHPCMQPAGELPVAPSAIPPNGSLFTHEGQKPFEVPRALEEAEIQRVIAQFHQAAVGALEAGFDGVDIHSANGYLIDQFLRDGANHRTDSYGGSIRNRTRFLIEVVEAVISVWGPERVGVRISPLQTYNSMHDSDPLALFSYVAKALADLGIAYLHVVEPGLGHPLATSTGLHLLRTLRLVFPNCLVVDGGRDRASAEAALAAPNADLVALATPFIANPDLVDRLARGLPLAQPDRDVFYGGGDRGYIDYPRFSDHALKVLDARR